MIGFDIPILWVKGCYVTDGWVVTAPSRYFFRYALHAMSS